jgi:hypothetical protein
MSLAVLLGGWVVLAQVHPQAGPPGACFPASDRATSRLATATTASTGPATSVSTQVQSEARRILANVRDTRYQHRTLIDEKRGIYKLDCSGLACAILRKVARRQLSEVAIETGKSRQRAWEFYETFAHGTDQGTPGWRTVGKMLDAVPGDLLARRRPEFKKGESTGHVMVIDEIPVLEKPGLVRVVVIDSTSQPHSNDTRLSGTDGVGRGTIWIEIDPQGRPVAWRNLLGAKASAAHFAIGRVIDMPE